MTILTENIVLSRTRAQDLNSVRKLNCWGSELTDVSIVRRMHFVEVLSLSVNKITTLAHFAHCNNLQELYLRKNNIQDLNEVCFLQSVPRLQNLWLAENPCAEVDHYRLTVLKALPGLQKLDNIFVQPEEVEQAKIYGLNLVDPREAAQQSSSMVESFSAPPSISRVSSQESHESRQERSTIICESEREVTSVRSQDLAYNNSATSANDTLIGEAIPGARNSAILSEEEEQTSQVIMPQHQHVFHARVQTLVDHSGRRARKSTEISCDTCGTLLEEQQVVDSLADGCQSIDSQFSDPDGTASSGDGYRHSLNESDVRPSQYDLSNHVEHKGIANTLAAAKLDKGSPAQILPKGGKNRNSNILSAILCLLKELDYASLEVVETAIHCRMEEMDD